jgi:fructose-specific phosphotransferase system IIC component
MMKRQLIGHLFGALTAALIGLVVAVVYILLVPTEGMDGMTAMGLTASIIVFPIACVAFTIFIWAPISLLWTNWRGAMSNKVALALGLVIGLVVAMVGGGPRGFSARGGTPLISYVFMLLFCLTALANHWFVRRRIKQGTAQKQAI